MIIQIEPNVMAMLAACTALVLVIRAAVGRMK